MNELSIKTYSAGTPAQCEIDEYKKGAQGCLEVDRYADVVMMVRDIYAPIVLFDVIDEIIIDEVDPQLWTVDLDMDVEVFWHRSYEIVLDMTGNLDAYDGMMPRVMSQSSNGQDPDGTIG